MENRIWRILVLRKTRIGEFFFFFFYQRILTLWKRRILVLWKTGTKEFSFCGKPESENFVFFFFFIREFSFCGNGESSFCRNRKLENSRFVKNQNWRICFFYFLSENSRFVETENSRFVENGAGEISFCGKPESEIFFFFFIFYPRILVFWKTGTEEFTFCGQPESENFCFFLVFFFSSENSRFMETGTGEFSFCGKPESENSLFSENQNPRILVFWKTRLREFWFCGKREFRNLWKTRVLVLCEMRIGEISLCRKRESEISCFLENANPRIRVLWKTRIREFPFCGKSE